MHFVIFGHVAGQPIRMEVLMQGSSCHTRKADAPIQPMTLAARGAHASSATEPTPRVTKVAVMPCRQRTRNASS